MAESTQDPKLWEELPFHPPQFTVLSWNIKGESGSLAEPRNILVPRVVNHVNPDVLLLQEIPSDKIIKKISSQAKRRKYEQVNAGIRSEARVVYDSDVFEPTCMSGVKHTCTCVPEVNLDNRVASVFHPEQGRQMRGVQYTLRNRVAAVRLRHKDTGRVIVFMSFHNIYKIMGDIHSDVTAKTFCQIVSADTWPDGTLVVGGADLNCVRFDHGNALVPDYEQHRRERKIDYYVAKQNDITLNGYVLALNILDEERFSLVWDDVDRHMENNTHFTRDHYDESLDHDPLVYELTW